MSAKPLPKNPYFAGIMPCFYEQYICGLQELIKRMIKLIVKQSKMKKTPIIKPKNEDSFLPKYQKDLLKEVVPERIKLFNP